MLNLDDLAKNGVIVKKFCGVPVRQDGDMLIACSNEAVGQLTAVVEEDGKQVAIPVPVCAGCLEKIQKDFEVDNDGGVLLD